MGQKFGQHFLSDTEILAKIADTVLGYKKVIKTNSLVEIGPGQGALTELIINEFESVELLEIDKSMEQYLNPLVESHKNAKVVRGDVLKSQSVNESISHIESSKPLIVGNLPYYITSPIFRKFFVEGSHIGGVFLIQKEVAEKIKTITKQKSYLRWLLNYSYDIELCFIVPATAFSPPPKVQSAVVKIQSISQSVNQPIRPNFDRMVEFLDIVSMYSRKTLRKIWKMREEDLKSFILPEELEGKRLQELGWEEMGRILNS